MSDYEPKEGAGNLFRNDKRETDAQPQYRGEIKIEGKVYRLSAWVRETKTGDKYFGIAATPKEPITPKRMDDDQQMEPLDDPMPF